MTMCCSVLRYNLASYTLTFRRENFGQEKLDESLANHQVCQNFSLQNLFPQIQSYSIGWNLREKILSKLLYRYSRSATTNHRSPHCSKANYLYCSLKWPDPILDRGIIACSISKGGARETSYIVILQYTANNNHLFWLSLAMPV